MSIEYILNNIEILYSSIFGYDNDYSKALKHIYEISSPRNLRPLMNTNLGGNEDLDNYQHEFISTVSILGGDTPPVKDIKPLNNNIKAVYVPLNINISLKFYTTKVSKTCKIWYKCIARWMLTDHILPNLDIPLKIQLDKPISLKYQSRFAKILGNAQLNRVYYISKPDMGRSLHALIDEHIVTNADLFEICKQIDISIDVYSKLGFVHGNLTPDNIMVVKFNRPYNYRIGVMSVSSQFLAIPCNFDNMYIVENGFIHRTLASSCGHIFGNDSKGRYDYNTFYFSLFHFIKNDHKYLSFRDYLSVNNIQSLQDIETFKFPGKDSKQDKWNLRLNNGYGMSMVGDDNGMKNPTSMSLFERCKMVEFISELSLVEILLEIAHLKPENCDLELINNIIHDYHLHSIVKTMKRKLLFMPIDSHYSNIEFDKLLSEYQQKLLSINDEFYVHDFFRNQKIRVQKTRENENALLHVLEILFVINFCGFKLSLYRLVLHYYNNYPKKIHWEKRKVLEDIINEIPIIFFPKNDKETHDICCEALKYKNYTRFIYYLSIFHPLSLLVDGIEPLLKKKQQEVHLKIRNEEEAQKSLERIEILSCNLATDKARLIVDMGYQITTIDDNVTVNSQIYKTINSINEAPSLRNINTKLVNIRIKKNYINSQIQLNTDLVLLQVSKNKWVGQSIYPVSNFLHDTQLYNIKLHDDFNFLLYKRIIVCNYMYLLLKDRTLSKDQVLSMADDPLKKANILSFKGKKEDTYRAMKLSLSNLLNTIDILNKFILLNHWMTHLCGLLENDSYAPYYLAEYVYKKITDSGIMNECSNYILFNNYYPVFKQHLREYESEEMRSPWELPIVEGEPGPNNTNEPFVGTGNPPLMKPQIVQKKIFSNVESNWDKISLVKILAPATTIAVAATGIYALLSPGANKIFNLKNTKPNVEIRDYMRNLSPALYNELPTVYNKYNTSNDSTYDFMRDNDVFPFNDSFYVQNMHFDEYLLTSKRMMRLVQDLQFLGSPEGLKY